MSKFNLLSQKLKITSLLDLALTIPISYQDNSISQSININVINTFDAIIKKINSYNGKLFIEFYIPKFQKTIKSIFFRTTAYHYQEFILGSKVTIQGKLLEYKNTLQMNQPKSLAKNGEIVPKYKTKLKQYEMLEFIKEYITYDNLAKEGLLKEEIDTLLSLHFPKKLEDFNLNDETLEILKKIEAFNYIKKLTVKRVDYPPVKSLNGDIKKFIKSLPFKLTPEQKSAIDDIRKDFLSTKKASKRMIVGDVGSGKTIVILASVMMAYPDKSILMAPTSLLAIQLYEEAIKFLPENIKIALVIQNRKIGDYQESDFVIGTHALLFKKNLPKAPLIMVDEQHRFGTKQRQKLETMARGVDKDKHSHFLQFSATPIPRTQAMMDSALIDMSLITTTPFKKQINTEVIGKSDFPNLLDKIKDEISKNHQILIVYPLVEESESIDYQSLDEARDFWENRFENVYLTHGKDKNKEKVLVDFREDGNILLATTVVEVGISLPRLTVIVIVGAERLGLATLHQLRGRVGRVGLESWCYLFSYKTSIKRLYSFAKTTNGFDIALLDLKYRNSGDILDGQKQSGQKFKWLNLADDEEIIKEVQKRIT